MDSYLDNGMRGIDASGEQLKLSAYTRLLASVDKLIIRFQRDPLGNRDIISRLQLARSDLEKSNFSSMYQTMNALKPIVEVHKNTNIIHRAFRAFLWLFDRQATKTTSERILQEIEGHLDVHHSRLSK